MNAEWLLLPWNCWKSGIRVTGSRLGAKFYLTLAFVALIFAFALEASCALSAMAKDLGQTKVSAAVSAISPDILTFSEDDKGYKIATVNYEPYNYSLNLTKAQQVASITDLCSVVLANEKYHEVIKPEVKSEDKKATK